jgi:hypothetical protein
MVVIAICLGLRMSKLGYERFKERIINKVENTGGIGKSLKRRVRNPYWPYRWPCVLLRLIVDALEPYVAYRLLHRQVGLVRERASPRQFVTTDFGGMMCHDVNEEAVAGALDIPADNIYHGAQEDSEDLAWPIDKRKTGASRHFRTNLIVCQRWVMQF